MIIRIRNDSSLFTQDLRRLACMVGSCVYSSVVEVTAHTGSGFAAWGVWLLEENAPPTLKLKVQVTNPTPLEILAHGRYLGASERVVRSWCELLKVKPSRRMLKSKLRWDKAKLESAGL